MRVDNNMKFKLRYILYSFIILFIITLGLDAIRISMYKNISDLPAKRIHTEDDDIYFELSNGEKEINWNRLDGTLNYINARYDVADFHVAMLVRLLYEYPDRIPPEMMTKIKTTLLNFKYWMDEPGECSMCFWSENHQILFASAEYLIGQLYPNEVFHNSGLTGKQHMDKASKRIFDWQEMRWKFGFSEFYSSVYYNEDIAGMINLIDYSKDERMVKRTEMIMDLLLYDIASQKSNNMFTSVSGRAYEGGRKGGPTISISRITNFIWDKTKKNTKPHINYGFVTSKKYKLPSVLFEIGKDSTNMVIKQSNGLNISELKNESYFGDDDRSMMMQWGMESFSNPEIIRNSLSYIRKNKMFANHFFKEFKQLDISLIQLFHLEPALVRISKPQSNGVAIQRGNTYTYKTNCYSLYTAQNYYPGNYANQVHVSGMNIGNSFSVFHLHPAIEKGEKQESPNYWVGYGRLPHSVQDSSVNLSIYNLPEKKGIFEKDMLHYTHAYFPKFDFDSTRIENNYAFGMKGKTYCAMIGKNDFYFRSSTDDDLIQQGNQTFWIIEAGDKDTDGSFKNFCSRILKNKIEFDTEKLSLSYTSKGKNYCVKYAGDFLINGDKIDTRYSRFDSPYIKAKFKPDSMEFRFRNKFLNLNFYKIKRECN
jgi:hypothetical protein